MILAIHHVQLAMPEGGETEAQGFYSNVLGLPERDKPAELRGRGGCWFERGEVRIHLGVENEFRAARKAHPAFVVDDLEDIEHRLSASDVAFERAGPVDGRDRIFCHDPFGNRIEIMASGRRI